MLTIEPQDAVKGADAIARMGAGLGAGLAVIGAGLGIGRIGGSGAEAIARQPEAADAIKGNSMIMAAFIEGVALFTIVITLLIMVL